MIRLVISTALWISLFPSQLFAQYDRLVVTGEEILLAVRRNANSTWVIQPGMTAVQNDIELIDISISHKVREQLFQNGVVVNEQKYDAVMSTFLRCECIIENIRDEAEFLIIEFVRNAQKDDEHISISDKEARLPQWWLVQNIANRNEAPVLSSLLTIEQESLIEERQNDLNQIDQLFGPNRQSQIGVDIHLADLEQFGSNPSCPVTEIFKAENSNPSNDDPLNPKRNGDDADNEGLSTANLGRVLVRQISLGLLNEASETGQIVSAQNEEIASLVNVAEALIGDLDALEEFGLNFRCEEYLTLLRLMSGQPPTAGDQDLSIAILQFKALPRLLQIATIEKFLIGLSSADQLEEVSHYAVDLGLFIETAVTGGNMSLTTAERYHRSSIWHGRKAIDLPGIGGVEDVPTIEAVRFEYQGTPEWYELVKVEIDLLLSEGEVPQAIKKVFEIIDQKNPNFLTDSLFSKILGVMMEQDRTSQFLFVRNSERYLEWPGVIREQIDHEITQSGFGNYLGDSAITVEISSEPSTGFASVGAENDEIKKTGITSEQVRSYLNEARDLREFATSYLQ